MVGPEKLSQTDIRFVAPPTGGAILKTPENLETPEKPNSVPWQNLIDRLRENSEKMHESEFRPCADIALDRDSIEDQRVKIIDAQDAGSYNLHLKLTPVQYESVLAQMENNDAKYDSNIVYESTSLTTGNNLSYSAGEAWALDLGGVELKIAKIVDDKESGQKTKRALLGAVEIKIKTQEALSSELLEKAMQESFKALGLENSLESPDEESETNYKIARYAWHNKIDRNQLTSEDIELIKNKLTKEEIYPGYSTMVEKGKSEEYAKICPFAIYHEINNSMVIPQIVKANGLKATHDRLQEGVVARGLSWHEDMQTGGGDNVFTRLMTPKEENSNFKKAAIIMNPDILDRTDVYTYASDKYGATNEKTFNERISPAEALTAAAKGELFRNNEQMFRHGIAAEKMLAIAVDGKDFNLNRFLSIFKQANIEMDKENAQALLRQSLGTIRNECQVLGIDQKTVENFISNNQRLSIIDILEKEGINEVNGIPVHDFVVEVNGQQDFMKLSQDRSGQSLNKE